MSDILEAADHLHAYGVRGHPSSIPIAFENYGRAAYALRLHRDIKPDNMVLQAMYIS